MEDLSATAAIQSHGIASVAEPTLIDDAMYRAMYEASIRDPETFWGEHGKRIDWIKPYYPRQELLLRLSRRLDQMVRGRHSQRLGQLHRPASEEARRPGRHHLGARRSERPSAPHHLSRAPSRGEHLRQCAQVDGGEPRRPRDHLPADDSRGGLRHARLRAHRRHSLRRVRRLLPGFPRRPHHRLPSRSSSSPPMKGCAAARRSSSSTTPTRR